MQENTPTKVQGVRVFVSYAHHDRELMTSLLRNLSSLKRSGLVSIWDDREIPPGDAWADVIDERLNQADVVLLLISAAFIDSPYCYGLEMQRAAERFDDPCDRPAVIPVILANCDWDKLPLARWQVLPMRLGNKGVSSWPSPADHHTAVTKDLRKRLTGLIDADSTLWQCTTRRLRDPLWWQQPGVWGAALAGLVALTAAGWAWQAAREAVALEVSAAESALRSGRYAEAQTSLAAQCGRWLIGEPACWAQQKVTIAQALAQPDTVDIEHFSRQVQKLQAQRPDDPDVLYLGGVLAIRGSSTAAERATVDAQAVRDIKRAIELAPAPRNFPEADFFLADLAHRERKFERALALLNRAIRGNPHGWHYLNARAAALAELGRLGEATEDYRISAQEGLIASRVDGPVLMWRRGQWKAAVAQLDAARQALAPPSALTGRNMLPWVYDLPGKDPLTLKTAADKRCLVALMRDVAQRLAEGDRAGTAPLGLVEDCGVDQRAGVPLAVAEMLAPLDEGQVVRRELVELANANGGGA